MQTPNDTHQVRLFCLEHGRPTESHVGATIFCNEGNEDSHVLSQSFPGAEEWEYCCDCECFYPLRQARKKRQAEGLSDDRCPVCERDLIRHYVCTECNVISHKSREREGRLFSISAIGLICPYCPSCLTPAPVAVREHDCRILSLSLTTAHLSCPFCKESIATETHTAGFQVEDVVMARVEEVTLPTAEPAEAEARGEPEQSDVSSTEAASGNEVANGGSELETPRRSGVLKRFGLRSIVVYRKRKAVTSVTMGLIAILGLLLADPVYKAIRKRFNNRPVLKTIQVDPPKLSSGGNVKLTAIAEDIDGDELDYDWRASTGTINYNKESASLSFSESAGHTAGAPIKVWLRVWDKDGADVRDTVEVGVLPPPQNHPPMLTDLRLSKEHVLVGERVQLIAAAEDPDEERLDYQWRPSAGSIENNGNRLAVLNTEGVSVSSGYVNITVMLTVKDARGLGVSDYLIVSVLPRRIAEGPTPAPTAPPNSPPRFLVPPPEMVEVTIGESRGLEAYAMDPDGDTLEYIWEPHRVKLEGRGPSVTLNTSDLSQVRSNLPPFVMLTVKDSRGASTFGLIRVRVRAAEQPRPEPVPTKRAEPTPTTIPPAAPPSERDPPRLLKLRH